MFKFIAFSVALLLASCGGGGSSSNNIAPIAVPTYTLKSGVDRVIISNTTSEIHNNVTADFNVKTDRYFALNPNAHFVFGVHIDTNQITTNVLGQGMVFGNVSGAQDGNPIYPSVQLESWSNNELGLRQNYLLPPSTATVILKDNTSYTVHLESRISNDRKIQTLSYTIYDSGVLVYASNIVYDPNTYFDVAQNGVFISQVFSSSNENWSIEFSNVTLSYPA